MDRNDYVSGIPQSSLLWGCRFISSTNHLGTLHHGVWVSINYRLSMIINNVTIPWGPGAVYVFLAREAELSVFGVNIPRAFGDIYIARSGDWIHVLFTYNSFDPVVANP